MVYKRSCLGQAVQLIVAEEAPAGVELLAVTLDDIAIDPPAKIGVVADDFSAQDVGCLFPQCLGDALHIELLPNRLKQHIDVTGLAGIPRAVEPDGVHREAGMVIEKHRQKDRLALGALAQLVH